MEKSSVELLRLGIENEIDQLHNSSYATGIILTFPVDRIFTNHEHGEIERNTGHYLKPFLLPRVRRRVQVRARNKVRNGQVYVEVEIRNGFPLQEH